MNMQYNRLLTLALLLACAAAGFAQSNHHVRPSIQVDDDAPPAPLTVGQLIEAQAETFRRLALFSYKKELEYFTLDDRGQITGSKTGAWRLLHLQAGPRVVRINESRSTLKRLHLPGKPLRSFVSNMPVFFTWDCPTRFTGYEEKDGRTLLRYRTWSAGVTPCFDGLVWVDARGRVAAADGRRSPAYEFIDGEEVVYPRGRYKMNADGFPETLEGEDILVFHTTFDKDKNGKPTPRRVRVRHAARFAEYEAPHTGVKVIEEGEPGETVGTPYAQDTPATQPTRRVSVQSAIYTVTAESLPHVQRRYQELVGGARDGGGAPQSVSSAEASAKFAALLQEAEREGLVKIVSRQTSVIGDGQQTRVSAGIQVGFFSELSLTTNEQPPASAPRVLDNTIRTLTLRPRVEDAPEGASPAVSLGVELEIKHGERGKAPANISQTISLRDGATVVLGGVRAVAGERHTFIALSASVIERAAEDAAAGQK